MRFILHWELVYYLLSFVALTGLDRAIQQIFVTALSVNVYN